MQQIENQNFLVYQQVLQGAKFRSLGHVECIRLKKNSWYRAGVAGCKFGSVGQMQCIT